MSFAWTFQGGRLVQPVTSVTLANNTALVVDKTVPAGKRWILLGAKMTNPDSVQRNCFMIIYKEAAKTNLLRWLTTATVAATSWMQYPNSNTGTSYLNHPTLIVLDAGNTITFDWNAGGASAGGVDADGLILEYLEMDVA